MCTRSFSSYKILPVQAVFTTIFSCKKQFLSATSNRESLLSFLEEFKDIVPGSKDIVEFVEQEKLMEPDFDFSKTVDLYIKATKYYQATELVSI